MVHRTDTNGSRKTLTAGLTGGGGETTEYVFGVTTTGGNGLNSNDALQAVWHPDPSTGAASSSEQDTVTVNALGQPLTRTDRNGTVHTYTYDALGRLTADAVTTLGSGVDGSVRRIEFAYDGQGNLYLITSCDAASGGNIVNQVKREFNGLGQLTSEWQEHSGAVTGSSLRVQYAYGEMPSGANHSRPMSMTYPNGKVLTFNYASGLGATVSRLTSLSDSTGTLESYDYLGPDRVVKRAHPQPRVDLTYVKQTGESDGEAGDQYIGLDRFGRVADQRWRVGSDSDIDRFQYGYDRGFHRTYKDNLVEGTQSEVAAYDGLGQLTDFARGTLNSTKDGISGTPARTQAFDLDAVGNFEAVTTDGSAETRTHNRQNEDTGLTYDAAGSVTARRSTDGVQFTYDAWGRLVEVTDAGDATLASYEYDGLDRRVRKNGVKATDLYYSALGQVVEERYSGATVTQYVWSPVYFNALVLRDRDTDADGSLDERLWAVQDANWNVTVLVDNSGNVVERYVYDPFGGVTVLDGSWAVRTGGSAYEWEYLWQGMRLESETGLYAAGYRDVDPGQGRPVQMDPLGFAAGDVNLYRWEGNTPASVTDPTGLAVALPPHLTAGLSHQQAILLTRLIVAQHRVPMKPSTWPWKDDVPIEEEDDPALYGADGDLKRSEIGPAIREDLGAFAEHMRDYAAEQILAALFGPLLVKTILAAIRAGWKLVKVGNNYFLKNGKKVVNCGPGIGCFAAGTPVLTPDGAKLIEDVRPGDVVLARAEEDPAAPVQARVVADVFRRSAPVLGLMIGGQTIRLTEEHPFFTLSRGWTKAYELRPGDWVLGKTGEWLPIGAVEPAGDPVVVYNMCVAGAHTFFVGKEYWGFAVWVHNSTGGPCEVFHNPADAIGDLNGVAKRVGEGRTRSHYWISHGYTEVHYFQDSNGVKWTVFYNPTTRQFSGAHMSSGQ